MFLTPQSGDSNLRFAITTGGESEEQQLNHTLPLVTSQWVHVSVTLADDTGWLYVDGSAVVSDTVTLNPSDVVGPNMWMGRSQSGVEAFFDGLLDDVAVFDRALSADEIAAVYATGWETTYGKVLALRMDDAVAYDGDAVYDASGQRHHGTLVTADVDNKSGPGHLDNALALDGTDDYVALPENLGDSAWIVIDGDALVVERDGDGDPHAFKGIPFVVSLLPEGIARFSLVGDLVLEDGETVVGTGSRAISLYVGGDVTIAPGAMVDISGTGSVPGPGGGMGGQSHPGGAGAAETEANTECGAPPIWPWPFPWPWFVMPGIGGEGGSAVDGCIPWPPVASGEDGEPGSDGQHCALDGTAGSGGSSGGGTLGGDGVASSASGGAVGGGGQGGAGGAGGEGLTEGGGGGAGGDGGYESGDAGEAGGDGPDGNPGYPGAPGLNGGSGTGGLNTGVGMFISGGGGGGAGRSGGGGGSGGAGSWGAGGGGGGGGGGWCWYSGGDGGSGGLGGIYAGAGGAGGQGGAGGAGGGGGGALEIVALGRMVAAGQFLSVGGDGKPSRPGQPGGTGGAGGVGFPGQAGEGGGGFGAGEGGAGGAGGNAGAGGDGGAGGNGGAGAGGAGGTIKLAAFWVDAAGATVVASGGTGGDPGNNDGGNGRFILGQTFETPFAGTVIDAQETTFGFLPTESNPYLAGSPATPFMPHVVGGPDIYGRAEGLTAGDLGDLLGDVPPQAGLAMLLLDTGLPGVMEWDVAGYDMLLVANLLNCTLMRPLLGVGQPAVAEQLLERGIMNHPDFGGDGPGKLQLGPQQVYATMVPEGLEHFNLGLLLDEGITAPVMALNMPWVYAQTLAYGQPLFLEVESGTGDIQAAFSADPVVGLLPLTVQFSDLSLGSPTRWAWDLGDGTTSAERHLSHTYTQAGAFTVTLTVSNDYCSNTMVEVDCVTVIEAAHSLYLPMVLTHD
jgi:hypothetical protein